MKEYNDFEQNELNEEGKSSQLKKKSKKEDKGVLRELLDYVIIIAVVAGAVFLLTQFVVINARIPSSSMENTISEGDRVFGNRLSYINSDPQRYDIVIFKYPDDESKLFIKRIIGLPGETVEIKNGKVYINGSSEPLDDSFCPETPTGDFGPYVVPENSYFVMGDNREHSHDSRYWTNHFVSKDKILGKAGFRYWPFNKIGMVS